MYSKPRIGFEAIDGMRIRCAAAEPGQRHRFGDLPDTADRFSFQYHAESQLKRRSS